MRPITVGALGAFILAFGAGTALADGTLVPSIRGARTVSAAEAQGAVAAGAIVLDLRDAPAYHQARLPGAQPALTAYDRESRRFDSAIFGGDVVRPIVLYHDGPSGVIAYYAVRSAAEAGYVNLLWLRGGLREWRGHGHPVDGEAADRRAAATSLDR